MFRTDSQTEKSLAKIHESLVINYLAANLNFRNVPLKEFMDDFEKKILLASLHQTNGNQKKAAVMLSLKPTALFEKMRKHGIRARRKKLSEKTTAEHIQKKE
ncbi:MAG: hypothetical protein JXI33_04740 [Candidatus Aminicenantes bacterium]|nr:hypothetical protein [Candidatus Aminicenantes bacterium]